MGRQNSGARDVGRSGADSLGKGIGTGRGVLYVIIAVLVGTFFVASVYFADGAESWGREGRWAAGFLQVYRLALLIGFPIQIVAAVVLRWLTRVSGMNRLAHWVVFGATIGFALPWIFARLGYVLEGVYFPTEWQTVKSAVMFPLMGAMMYEAHPAWVRVAVGAATGGTLRLMIPHLARRDD
jgi:hypothetical protein